MVSYKLDMQQIIAVIILHCWKLWYFNLVIVQLGNNCQIKVNHMCAYEAKHSDHQIYFRAMPISIENHLTNFNSHQIYRGSGTGGPNPSLATSQVSQIYDKSWTDTPRYSQKRQPQELTIVHVFHH